MYMNATILDAQMSGFFDGVDVNLYDLDEKETYKGQYISLKPKRGKKKTRKLQSGIMPESKTTRSFRCTDYAKWMLMTRCVNR